jgi:hypothetical protein
MGATLRPATRRRLARRRGGYRDGIPPAPPDEVVARVQSARMLADLSDAALARAEARLGPFDAATTALRQVRDEAVRLWDRLRAELGLGALEAALAAPPLAVYTIEDAAAFPTEAPAALLAIAGRTYRAEPVPGTADAPAIWRLTHLAAGTDGDPYFVCRLDDGTMQCDCGEWTFHVMHVDDAPPCKHLVALRALGWI